FVFSWKRLDALRPRRNRVEHQQQYLDDRDRDFGPLRDLALGADVAGRRVRAAAEPEQHVEEIDAPADEQHQHQPVHETNHLVDLAGVRRRRGRQSEIVQHRAGPSEGAKRPASAVALSCATRLARRTRWMKNDAKAHRTRATTPSMNSTPVFVAIAIGASLLPKHTGQASAARGAATSPTANAAFRISTTVSSCVEMPRR